jgi:hypothetical protein
VNKEFLKMQKLAGLITESQYTQLIENEELVDRILDKISKSGLNSLTYTEKEYLDKYGKNDPDLREPYFLSKGQHLYTPEMISFLEKVLYGNHIEPNLLLPTNLKPLSSDELEGINKLPDTIKNYFPLKKGDYQKLDEFMIQLTDIITMGEESYPLVSTFLGVTADEMWEQNYAALMLGYLNQGVFTTPEITLQIANSIISDFGIV